MCWRIWGGQLNELTFYFDDELYEDYENLTTFTHKKNQREYYRNIRKRVIAYPGEREITYETPKGDKVRLIFQKKGKQAVTAVVPEMSQGDTPQAPQAPPTAGDREAVKSEDSPDLSLLEPSPKGQVLIEPTLSIYPSLEFSLKSVKKRVEAFKKILHGETGTLPGLREIFSERPENFALLIDGGESHLGQWIEWVHREQDPKTVGKPIKSYLVSTMIHHLLTILGFEVNSNIEKNLYSRYSNMYVKKNLLLEDGTKEFLEELEKAVKGF